MILERCSSARSLADFDPEAGGSTGTDLAFFAAGSSSSSDEEMISLLSSMPLRFILPGITSTTAGVFHFFFSAGGGEKSIGLKSSFTPTDSADFFNFGLELRNLQVKLSEYIQEKIDKHTHESSQAN